MEKEIDPDVIKATQITLGKYVKRPPLSEKLLKKPPFRFLHDIITTVLKTTGFFENLFDEEELVSDNVKDRDNKILFLNKVIFVLNITTGKPLSAKPSKIVAGQEADKTNELLQCLAQVLDKKLSSQEAVNKYKESLKSPQAIETKTKDTAKSVKKGNDVKKLTSKSSEKLTNPNLRSNSKNDKDKVNDNRNKRKEVSNKAESQPKKSQPSKASNKKSVDNKGKSNDDPEKKTVKKSTIADVKEKLPLPNKIQRDTDSLIENDSTTVATLIKDELSAGIEPSNLNDSYTIAEHDLNSTASSRDLLEAVNVIENHESAEPSLNELSTVTDDPISSKLNDGDSINNIELSGVASDIPKSSFKVDQEDKEPESVAKDTRKEDTNTKLESPPTTAKDLNNYSVRPQSVRPSSSRPGAPRMRDKVDNTLRDADNLLLGKVNIIAETIHNEEDEDMSLVVIDQPLDSTFLSKDLHEISSSSNEHGHLVQQILESQKELSQIAGKTEIEWQFGAQRAREAMNQEIEQLRFNIQALSRVANPIGKLLDHIQEDVEVMRQELQQWINIYDEVNKEMLVQKTINEDSLLPLHAKLKQLDRDTEEKHDKINDLKILIYKNASRIEKLLANGNVQ